MTKKLTINICTDAFFSFDMACELNYSIIPTESIFFFFKKPAKLDVGSIAQFPMFNLPTTEI